jgi:hypothetical protein
MEYISDEDYKKIVGVWNMAGIKTRIKTFMFKFFNNSLGLNTRTVHYRFNNLIGTRGCTLCSLNGVANPPDESFLHMFVDCPISRTWRDRFTTEHLGLGNIGGVEYKKIWLLGILPGGGEWNLLVFINIILFQFSIWEQKLQKRAPTYVGLFNDFVEELSNVISSKNSWVKNYEDLIAPLRRILLPGRHDEGRLHQHDGEAGRGGEVREREPAQDAD